MDKMVDVDEKPTMIFRNPAKEMLTLAMTGDYGSGKLLCRFVFKARRKSLSLIARIKEMAPKLRAAAEAKAAKEAKEAAELAEKNKPPKVVVTLPADAKRREADEGLDQVHGRQGESQSGHQSLRGQFRDAGWKEDVASIAGMAGTLLFSKKTGKVSTLPTPTLVSCPPRSIFPPCAPNWKRPNEKEEVRRQTLDAGRLGSARGSRAGDGGLAIA